jgi:hypothetical protein
MRIENETFAKEEEQDPVEFEQPEFEQGKCRHHLIILIYTLHVIYFHCMCLILQNPKDLIRPIYHSLST